MIKKKNKLSTVILLLNSLSVILVVFLLLAFLESYRLTQEVQIENTKRINLTFNANRFIDGSAYLTQEVRAYTATGDEIHYDNYWNEVNNLKNRDFALDEMIKIGITDKEKETIQAMQNLSNNLIPLEEKAMKDVRLGDFPSAIEDVYGETYQIEIEKIYTLQAEFLKMLAIRTANTIQKISDSNNKWLVGMIAWIIFVIALQIINFAVIRRKIFKPIKYAIEQIQYIGEGDLSFENKLKYYRVQKNEIGIIASSLHALKTNISCVFKNIVSVAEEVAKESQQISTASQSVSSTLEEMTSNIRQSADNAIKTRNISKQAVENAHKGKEAVNESLDAVKKIALEISVIDGIAS